MNKRGRPPLPPERRREVSLHVRVTAQAADGLFVYAQRRRMPMTKALGDLLERLARREQEIGGMVDCRIQTP